MKISKYELPDNTTVTIEVQHVYKNKYSACGVGYVSVVGKVKDKMYSFYLMNKNPFVIKRYTNILKLNINNLAFKSADHRQALLNLYLDDVKLMLNFYQTSVS